MQGLVRGSSGSSSCVLCHTESVDGSTSDGCSVLERKWLCSVSCNLLRLSVAMAVALATGLASARKCLQPGFLSACRFSGLLLPFHQCSPSS